MDYKSEVRRAAGRSKPLIQNGLIVRDFKKGGGFENLHPWRRHDRGDKGIADELALQMLGHVLDDLRIGDLPGN